MNVEALKDNHIQWADYVFISAMNIQKESSRRVVDRCKAIGTKTVGGGPLFTTDTESFDDVDHLLLYEGENCIPQFLSDLENGSPKHIYDFAGFPELTATPVPAWELLNMNKYAMLCMQYSRGCPFHCDFCNVVTLFGHTPRTKSADQVINELETFYKLGWRGGIFFVDDNFIANKKKLKDEILPAITSWQNEKKHPFGFFTEASMNIADDEELMALMSEAGFDCVFIGIETVDEDSLAECNKSTNRKRDMVEDVKRIQRHGIQVQGGFILGFDSDKPSVFSAMVDFIQNSGIVTAMVGMLNAPKGTKLFMRLEEEGRLLDEFTGSNEIGINFVSKMDVNDLVKGYNNVLRAIYAPKNYYKRIKTFLANYRPNKQSKNGFGFQSITAFFRACFHLGIASAGRLEYWKLLVWSFHKGRDTFALAVKFAIYGYHFRKCIKET